MTQSSQPQHYFPLPQEIEQPLQCPYAHRHHHQGQAQGQGQLKEVSTATCPYRTQDINQEEMHDEMPPEHEELPQEVEQPLQCPYLHRHQLQDHYHKEQSKEVSAATCPYRPQDYNQEEMHDEMPPEHEELPQEIEQQLQCPYAHRHQLQDHHHKEQSKEVSAATCPYRPQDYNQEEMHDEMPPEHEELKKGYSGNTCPFLETNTDTADNEEEAVQISVLSGILLPENDAEPNVVQTISRDPPTSLLTIHAPQNAIEARQRMDQVIEAQREAQRAIDRAKEEIVLAQKNLIHAEAHKVSADEVLVANTEELTDLLLQEYSQWNSMYQTLVEYKAKHGHCDVKRQLTKEEKEAFPELAALSLFVGKIRSEGRKPQGHPERIEPYRIVALNRIGFDWAPRDNAWIQNYEKVKAYLEENPGKLPQRRKSELGVWANGQIIEYNKFMAGNTKAYITQKKIDMLNDINFPWDRTQNTWMERFQSLQKFHAKYGHCRLTKTYEDQVLYRWVTKERMKYRNHIANQKPCQTAEQWNLLKDIGLMEGSKIPVVAKKRKLDEDMSCPHQEYDEDIDGSSI